MNEETSHNLSSQLKDLEVVSPYADPHSPGMVTIDVAHTPAGLSIDTLSNFINIKNTSLAKNHQRDLELVFGKCANIDRAIDYYSHPNVDEAMLMKPILGKADRGKLGRHHGDLPNFWAYIGYVIIERITQDDKLRKMLVSNDKGIINVDITSVSSFKGEIKSVRPIKRDVMYLGVVRFIVETLRYATEENMDLAVEYEIAINALKKNKNVSVFAGTGLEINFI